MHDNQDHNPPDIEDLSSIEEIENIWIEMKDGVLLAARLWLPRNAHRHPVPAVFEYIPYRKRDFMRERDEPMHRYFSIHGYASLRVDVRGTGDSGGVLEDEYTETEHLDAIAVIEWVSAQPWCTGSVGMTGISWGGFNALQVAAHAPPALKAIIAVCASDDRYTDDAHYKGGCLLNENMQWGSVLMLNAALPPDPQIVGDAWREIWSRRIDAVKPFPVVWMEHPWRDDYWRHGSICEDYDAIECAVYAIGGWADGYSNSVPRMMENLKGPKKGLIGPWAHAYPHIASPGPQIDYFKEAVRWWDRWLKGVSNTIMDEPMFRAWIQDPARPKPSYTNRPGRWVGEREWPSERIIVRRLFIGFGALIPESEESREISFSSPCTLGHAGGDWCGFGAEGEAPRDQRVDDGGSIVFDSDRLEDPVDVLGAPVIELDVKSDRPVAYLVARLCDVDEAGRSTRVSYGILNLCHHSGSARPERLVPDRWYRIRLQLDDLGQNIPRGHRLRLALSTDYWPMIWPPPEPAKLTVKTGTSWIDIPVRPPDVDDERLQPFGVPVVTPGAKPRKLKPMPMRRTIQIDLATDEYVYTLTGDGGEFGGASLARLDEIDLELGYEQTRIHKIAEDDPLSAVTQYRHKAILSRDGWKVEINCETSLHANAEGFIFTGRLSAYENGTLFSEKGWNLTVERRLL